MSIYEVQFQEGGTAIVRARLAAPDGTGLATGVSGEGKWLRQDDFSTITWEVFKEVDNAWESVGSGSLTVSSVIFDSPITSTENWTKDTVGHNFVASFSATLFSDGNVNHKIEIKCILTGGTVFWGVFEGLTSPVSTE